MSTIPKTSSTAGTAWSRLTAAQEASVRNMAASFGMEGMTFTDAELEVLASYALGEATREECIARLDGLNGIRTA